MADNELLTIENMKQLIGTQLTDTKKGLRTWGTLDYIFLAVGISFPLAAAGLGGKSVLQGPVFQSTQGNPAWARTCGFIALIALVGALANALHKGFNMSQRHRDLQKKKLGLTKLQIGCSHKPNVDQIQKKLILIVGGVDPSTAT